MTEYLLSEENVFPHNSGKRTLLGVSDEVAVRDGSKGYSHLKA